MSSLANRDSHDESAVQALNGKNSQNDSEAND